MWAKKRHVIGTWRQECHGRLRGCPENIHLSHLRERLWPCCEGKYLFVRVCCCNSCLCWLSYSQTLPGPQDLTKTIPPAQTRSSRLPPNLHRPTHQPTLFTAFTAAATGQSPTLDASGLRITRLNSSSPPPRRRQHRSKDRVRAGKGRRREAKQHARGEERSQDTALDTAQDG